MQSPFLGDRKKRCRTDKLSKIKASDLILLARRRTRVRRVAKFVRSIKHNFFINFRFSIFLRGSIGLLNLQNPLLFPVLYGLRFFYIPLFRHIAYHHHISTDLRTEFGSTVHNELTLTNGIQHIVGRH